MLLLFWMPPKVNLTASLPCLLTAHCVTKLLLDIYSGSVHLFTTLAAFFHGRLAPFCGSREWIVVACWLVRFMTRAFGVVALITSVAHVISFRIYLSTE